MSFVHDGESLSVFLLSIIWRLIATNLSFGASIKLAEFAENFMMMEDCTDEVS